MTGAAGGVGIGIAADTWLAASGTGVAVDGSAGCTDVSGWQPYKPASSSTKTGILFISIPFCSGVSIGMLQPVK